MRWPWGLVSTLEITGSFSMAGGGLGGAASAQSLLYLSGESTFTWTNGTINTVYIRLGDEGEHKTTGKIASTLV